MDNSLSHHGVKGQKWGRRRYQNKDGSLTKAGKRRRAKETEEDISSMSDQELRTKINRMNLEKRYMNLTRKDSRVSSAFNKASKGTSMGTDGGKITKNAMELRKPKIGKDASDTEKLNLKKHESAVGGAKLTTKGFDFMGKNLKFAGKVSNMVEENRHVKNTKPKLAKMSDDDLKKVVERMDLEQQYKNIKKESVDRGKINASQVLDIAGDVLAIGASATAIAVAIYNLKKGGK